MMTARMMVMLLGSTRGVLHLLTTSDRQRQDNAAIPLQEEREKLHIAFTAVEAALSL
jgi:hypothetical protein